MNLELMNGVVFQDHLLTFVNETINNIVVFQRQELCVSIIIILILNCLSNKIIGVLKETQLAATSINPDGSKGLGKRKQEPGQTTSGDKELPKNAKPESSQAEQNAAPEPKVEENPQARDGVGSYDNDGSRIPEGQKNTDLENDNPPSFLAVQREELSISEEDRQKLLSGLRNMYDMLKFKTI